MLRVQITPIHHPPITPTNVALAIAADLAQQIVTAADSPTPWGGLEHKRSPWHSQAYALLGQITHIDPRFAPLATPPETTEQETP